jgi:hypothetical protein
MPAMKPSPNVPSSTGGFHAASGAQLGRAHQQEEQEHRARRDEELERARRERRQDKQPRQQPRQTYERPLSAGMLSEGAGLAGTKASLHADRYAASIESLIATGNKHGVSTTAPAGSQAAAPATDRPRPPDRVPSPSPFAHEGLDETGWEETWRGSTGIPIATAGFRPTPTVRGQTRQPLSLFHKFHHERALKKYNPSRSIRVRVCAV